VVAKGFQFAREGMRDSRGATIKIHPQLVEIEGGKAVESKI